MQCCSVLKCVEMCCSVLQCIAVCRSVLQWTRMCTMYVHFYAHDTARKKINTTAKRDPDSPPRRENPGPFWPWY